MDVDGRAAALRYFAQKREERRAWIRRQRRRATIALLSLAAAVVIAIAAISFAALGKPEGGTHPSYFDLPRLDGPGRVQLATFRGHPVVVSFFNSNCRPCQSQLPGFARVAKDISDRVRFVAVNASESGDGREVAHQLQLAEHGFILARDIGGELGSGLHDALGDGMPITAFYDAGGRLLDVVTYALPEPVLRTKLHTLFATP